MLNLTLECENLEANFFGVELEMVAVFPHHNQQKHHVQMTPYIFLTLIIYACWPNRHYFTAMRTFAVAKLLFQKDYLNKYADLESTFNQL